MYQTKASQEWDLTLRDLKIVDNAIRELYLLLLTLEKERAPALQF